MRKRTDYNYNLVSSGQMSVYIRRCPIINDKLLTWVKTHTLGTRFLGFAEGFFVLFSVSLPIKLINNEQKKHYRRFLLLLAMLPVGTFAKDNFKMTGKIDGVGNDTLCIEYVILQPQKQIVNRKVAVENGEFSFSAKLSEAYSGSMFLKSNPETDQGTDSLIRPELRKESTKQNHKRVMRPRSRIQTTGPNNGHQLRDYSKSSNRSETVPWSTFLGSVSC